MKRIFIFYILILSLNPHNLSAQDCKSWLDNKKAEYNKGKYISGHGECSMFETDAEYRAFKIAIQEIISNFLKGFYTSSENVTSDVQNDTEEIMKQYESFFSAQAGVDFKGALQSEHTYCTDTSGSYGRVVYFVYCDKDALLARCEREIYFQLDAVNHGVGNARHYIDNSNIYNSFISEAETELEKAEKHLAEITKIQKFMINVFPSSEKGSISNSINDARISHSKMKANGVWKKNQIDREIAEINARDQAIQDSIDRENQKQQEFLAKKTAHKQEIQRNGKAVAASLFIPGLGQMLKGHHGHGWGVLLGEAGFAAGAIVTYTQSRKQLEIMKDPNVSITSFQQAKKSYNAYRISNIVILSAAAALYVGNIFEAIFMDCRWESKHHRLCHAAIIPTDEGLAVGLGLTLNL